MCPAALIAVACALPAQARSQPQKPNTLVIWDDDICAYNLSAYNHGIMGYETPNIDRIASEGVLFTGRAADNIWLFIPVQELIQKFLATLEGYPFQEGVTVGGEGVNYRTIRNMAILKQLGEKGLLERPGN